MFYRFTAALICPSSSPHLRLLRLLYPSGTPSTRLAPANISSQPYGWEHKSDVSSSTAPTSAFGSSSSVGGHPTGSANQGGVEHDAQEADLKTIAHGVGNGAERSRKAFSAGGRRSGSWAGSSSLDREFHVILKAGVDVYKHCCKSDFLFFFFAACRGYAHSCGRQRVVCLFFSITLRIPPLQTA